MPGKNAKRVGVELTPMRNRFPCCTQAPPVFRLRSANGPLVVLEMPSDGWSFHEPRKRIGRLMPVSQSSVLWKSPGEDPAAPGSSRSGRGVDGSSTRNVTESRPSLVSSVAWIEFCQLNEPNRTGVSKLSAVTRVPASSAMVSIAPPGRIWKSESRSGLEVVLLVRLRPGDQVMSAPSASGTGETVSAGSSCWTPPSVMSCRRLPPRVSVPQP